MAGPLIIKAGENDNSGGAGVNSIQIPSVVVSAGEILIVGIQTRKNGDPVGRRPMRVDYLADAQTYNLDPIADSVLNTTSDNTTIEWWMYKDITIAQGVPKPVDIQWEVGVFVTWTMVVAYTAFKATWDVGSLSSKYFKGVVKDTHEVDTVDLLVTYPEADCSSICGHAYEGSADPLMVPTKDWSLVAASNRFVGHHERLDAGPVNYQAFFGAPDGTSSASSALIFGTEANVPPGAGAGHLPLLQVG